MRLHVGAATHKGRVRVENQDCIYVAGWVSQRSGAELSVMLDLEDPLTVAVFDGMGGHAGGARASLAAAVSLAGRPVEIDHGVIADLLGALNEDVVELGRNLPGHSGMGTTVAGLVAQGRRAVAFNIGDSRVYRVAGGYLGQLSVDDRVADPRGSRSGLVSQSLGGPVPRAFDIHPLSVELEPEQTYVICTDGLFESVDARDIAERSSGEPLAAAVALRDLALEVGAPDNVTIIVIRVLPDSDDGTLNPAAPLGL